MAPQLGRRDYFFSTAKRPILSYLATTFGHDSAYTARAREVGNGEQQVDGAYEQVNHRHGRAHDVDITRLSARLLFFARIYEFAHGHRCASPIPNCSAAILIADAATF